MKLYQKFTHPKMFKERSPNGRRPAVGDDVCSTRWRSSTQRDLDDFKRGIEPLASQASLARCSRSFPPSFKNDAAHRADYLQWLLRAFNGYPLAVELRHRSWSDALGDTLSLLNAHGAAFVQIDEPKFQVLDPRRTTCRTSRRSITCGSTAGTPRSGGATTNRKTATTISTRPSELQGVRRDGRRRAGDS